MSAVLCVGLVLLISRIDWIIVGLIALLFSINRILFINLIESFLENRSEINVRFVSIPAKLSTDILVESKNINSENINLVNFELTSSQFKINFQIETKSSKLGVFDSYNLDYWFLAKDRKVLVLFREEIWVFNGQVWKREEIPVALDHFQLDDKFCSFSKESV